MELLACPFCGGLDIKILLEQASDKPYAILCSVCLFTTNEFVTDAEAITYWNTRASAWVSVKDRLPERNEKYLVVFDNGKLEDSIAFSSFFIETKEFNHTNITHWIPLPSPPKETK